MGKLNTASAKTHRYEIVRDDGTEFVSYQQLRDDGFWQTVATWMIPRVGCI